MQIFIRRPAGIGNLKRLLHELKKHQLPLRIHAETLFEMRAIVNELDGLDKEISGLEDRMRLFSANATKKKALALLKKRQQRLLRDLERLTEAGTE